MPRCGVRWKRNPHRACSPSIFHGYSEVAALGHASFNLARSTRAVKTPNPRRPIAFPCCRRLLYVYSKSFPVPVSLFRASAFQLPFQVAPALKYRARRSWISGAGVSAAKLSCRLVTKSRELPRILRAAIHGASFALFISFDRTLRNLTSIRRLPMRDFDWYPLIRLALVMNKS